MDKKPWLSHLACLSFDFLIWKSEEKSGFSAGKREEIYLTNKFAEWKESIMTLKILCGPWSKGERTDTILTVQSALMVCTRCYGIMEKEDDSFH